MGYYNGAGSNEVESDLEANELILSSGDGKCQIFKALEEDKEKAASQQKTSSSEEKKRSSSSEERLIPNFEIGQAEIFIPDGMTKQSNEVPAL